MQKKSTIHLYRRMVKVNTNIDPPEGMSVDDYFDRFMNNYTNIVLEAAGVLFPEHDVDIEYGFRPDEETSGSNWKWEREAKELMECIDSIDMTADEELWDKDLDSNDKDFKKFVRVIKETCSDWLL